MPFLIPFVALLFRTSFYRVNSAIHILFQDKLDSLFIFRMESLAFKYLLIIQLCLTSL